MNLDGGTSRVVELERVLCGCLVPAGEEGPTSDGSLPDGLAIVENQAQCRRIK